MSSAFSHVASAYGKPTHFTRYCSCRFMLTFDEVEVEVMEELVVKRCGVYLACV
jgi:hypothetical protein